MKNIRFFYLFTLCSLFIFCTNKKVERYKIICNNSYRYWMLLDSDSVSEDNCLFFKYFDKYGNMKGYWLFKHRKNEQLMLDKVTDVIYPEYWEIFNDSTILFKWTKEDYYDLKIKLLNRDTLIIQDIKGKNQYTYVTPPDSIKYLLKLRSSSEFRKIRESQYEK